MAGTAIFLAPVAAGADPGVVTVECRLAEHTTDGRTHDLDDGIPFLALHWSSAGVPRLDPVRVTAGLPEPDGYSLRFEQPLKVVQVERCLGRRDLFQLIRTTPREVIFKPGRPSVVVRLLRDVRSVMVLDPETLQERIDRAGNAQEWQEMEGLIAAAAHLDVPLDLEYQKELAYFNQLRELGLREFGDKAFRDAVHHLDPVVERRPQDFEAALALAKAQYQIGRYGDALHHFERLRTQNPDHPEVLLHLGLLGLARDDLRAAATHLRRAWERGARDAPFFLGFALYKRREHEGARAALQEFLAGNPRSDLAPRARGLLRAIDRGPAEPGAESAVAAEPVPRSGPPVELNVPAPVRPEPLARTPPSPPPAAPQAAVRLADSPLIFRGFRRPALALSEYRGQAAVLHLWASWCGPCLDELPSLIRFYQTAYPELREAGLELVVLSVDHDEADLTRFVDQILPELADLPLYWDPNWTLAAELGLDSALPKTILVGRDGRVHRIQQGSLDWQGRGLADELSALAGGRQD